MDVSLDIEIYLSKEEGLGHDMCAEGCYNFRVSQLINEGNSAAMVLFEVYLTRWLYFLSQKLSKGHTIGMGGNQLE